MKTALAWIIVIVAIVGVGGLYWYWQSTRTASQAPTQQKTEKYFYPDTNTATAVPAENTFSLGTQLGGTILVKDFLKDPSTYKSTVNPGYFYLGYHYDESFATGTPPADPPYVIEYVESTQRFNIALLREPLGATRVSAQQFLMTKLNVPQSQLCQLKYSVGVPNRVNSDYAGADLRFSFCPSATQLP